MRRGKIYRMKRGKIYRRKGRKIYIMKRGKIYKKRRKKEEIGKKKRGNLYKKERDKKRRKRAYASSGLRARHAEAPAEKSGGGWTGAPHKAKARLWYSLRPLCLALRLVRRMCSSAAWMVASGSSGRVPAVRWLRHLVRRRWCLASTMVSNSLLHAGQVVVPTYLAAADLTL